MDAEDVMNTLAQTYWGRPAIDPELIAMVGEMHRDSASIAAGFQDRGNVFFNIEPAAFERILADEAKR